jgi:hypothetical protein
MGFSRVYGAIAWGGLLAALGGCFQSDLGTRFQQGAGKQDDLNTRTLDLWERSPSADSQDDSLTSKDSLDVVVPRTPIVFRDLVDLREELGSRDISIFRTYQDRSTPTFYEWAGRYIAWGANTDFKVLRGYHMAGQAIKRVDDLIEENLLPSLTWRETTSLSQRVLPLSLYANSTRLPNGFAAFSSDSGYCPMLNANYRSNASQVCPDNSSDCWCIDRSSPKWQELRGENQLGKALLFFTESDLPVPRFNPIDDGDSFHSIFARVLVDATRADLAEQPPGFNPDVDSVMNALTDYFAAAMVRDPEIYRYSFANYKVIAPEQFLSTLASSNQRDVSNQLYFPDASLYSLQLNARPLSGALNDIRSLISGDRVTLLQGGACSGTCAISSVQGTALFTRSEAWDKVVGLAFTALRNSSVDENSTFHGYGKALIRACRTISWCVGQQTSIKSILQGRGMLSRREFQNLGGDYATRNEKLATNTDGTVNTTTTTYSMLKLGGNGRRHGILLQQTLGWAPVRAPGAGTLADADNLIEPCELVYIFPRFVNNTNDDWWGETDSVSPPGNEPAYPLKVSGWSSVPKWRRGIDIFDVEFELKSISGAKSLLEFSSNQKVIPWVAPGEDTQTLITNQSARFYKSYQDARFQQASSSMPNSTPSGYASKIGYLVRAPTGEDGSSSTLQAQFQVRFQAFNLDKIIPGAGGLFFDGTFDDDDEENSFSTFTQFINVDTGDDSFPCGS